MTLEEGEETVACVTYRELEARSAMLARGLLARGIGKGRGSASFTATDRNSR
ncbi:hypothetical protein ACFSLT_11225 [Novosphingobium resinovorum]